MSGDAGEVKVGVATKFTFAVRDEFGALKSGLLDAAFTKTLRDDSGASAVSVTISERGSTGVYDAALTPNVTGESWYLLVEHSSYGKWDAAFRVTARARDDLAYPTTTGRSLNVSAAGEADANVAKWLTATPNALQSGRVDGYLGAVATGVIAAASFAANALDAVWSTTTRALTDKSGYGLASSAVQAIWDALTANLVGGNSIGAFLVARLDATVSSRPTAAANAAAVWDEALSGHATAGTAGKKLTDIPTASAPSAATIAGAVWDEARASHTTVGTFGQGVASVTGAVGSVTGAVGSVTGAVGSVTGAVGSVTGDVGGKVLGGGAGAITGTGVRADVRAWNGSVPNDLVASRVDVSVGNVQGSTIDANAWATDAISAAAVSAAAVTKIQAGLATSASVPTANQNADALLDRASAIDGATPRTTLARIAASSHGKVSGMASGTPTFLGQDGSTSRIVATVDADGNRTAVTLP